jgi:DNA-binding protein HU-beta
MVDKTTTPVLIKAIAAATQMSNADVTRVLDAFKAVTTTSLNDGKPVILAGLGTFNPKHREARMGRNPSTGEALQIAASKGVKFTPSKLLKDALNA